MEMTFKSPPPEVPPDFPVIPKEAEKQPINKEKKKKEKKPPKERVLYGGVGIIGRDAPISPEPVSEADEGEQRSAEEYADDIIEAVGLKPVDPAVHEVYHEHMSPETPPAMPFPVKAVAKEQADVNRRPEQLVDSTAIPPEVLGGQADIGITASEPMPIEVGGSVSTEDVRSREEILRPERWKITVERRKTDGSNEQELQQRRSFLEQAFSDRGEMKQALVKRIKENLEQGYAGPATTLLDRRFSNKEDYDTALKLLTDFEKKPISIDDLLAEATIRRNPNKLKSIKLLSVALLEPFSQLGKKSIPWTRRSATEKSFIRLGEMIGLEIERRQIEAVLKQGHSLSEQKRGHFRRLFSGYSETGDIPEWFGQRLNKTVDLLENQEQRVARAPVKSEQRSSEAVSKPAETPRVAPAPAEKVTETRKLISLEQMTAEKVHGFNEQALQSLLEQREEEYANSSQEAKKLVTEGKIVEDLLGRLYVSVGDKLSPDVPYGLHYFQRYLPHVMEDINPKRTDGGLVSGFRRWFAGTKTYGLFSWNRYPKLGNLRFETAKAMRVVSRDSAYKYHTSQERELIGLLANRLEVQTLRDALRQQG